MMKQKGETPIEFTIPARYYSRGQVDWESSVPARGYNGEKEMPMVLSTANTAILCMHCSNVGIGEPGAAEYVCEERVEPYFRELNDRKKVMIEQHMAPLFNAARTIGLRLMYIVAGWPCAEKYATYREISSRVKPPPAKEKPSPPPGPGGSGNAFNPQGLTWRQEITEESLGKGFGVRGESNIPSVTAARAEDWVVTWTPHASTLLNENGIWNILLVGTDTSGCLLTTDCGLLPMAPLGFRCIVVEDCTESAEFPETRDKKLIRWGMLRSMQLAGYCYLTEGSAVVEAIGKARKEAAS